jgi:hypothetical protein
MVPIDIRYDFFDMDSTHYEPVAYKVRYEGEHRPMECSYQHFTLLFPYSLSARLSNCDWKCCCVTEFYPRSNVFLERKICV